MKLIIILLRFIVSFILLFIMLPSCIPYQNMQKASQRYDAINTAYPHLDLYEVPTNETEIVAIDWKTGLVFMIKIGGQSPYNFMVLRKARNSDFIKKNNIPERE
jgi:hypothetical protein